MTTPSSANVESEPRRSLFDSQTREAYGEDGQQQQQQNAPLEAQHQAQAQAQAQAQTQTQTQTQTRATPSLDSIETALAEVLHEHDRQLTELAEELHHERAGGEEGIVHDEADSGGMDGAAAMDDIKTMNGTHPPEWPATSQPISPIPILSTHPSFREPSPILFNTPQTHKSSSRLIQPSSQPRTAFKSSTTANTPKYLRTHRSRSSSPHSLAHSHPHSRAPSPPYEHETAMQHVRQTVEGEEEAKRKDDDDGITTNTVVSLNPVDLSSSSTDSDVAAYLASCRMEMEQLNDELELAHAQKAQLEQRVVALTEMFVSHASDVDETDTSDSLEWDDDTEDLSAHTPVEQYELDARQYALDVAQEQLHALRAQLASKEDRLASLQAAEKAWKKRLEQAEQRERAAEQARQEEARRAKQSSEQLQSLQQNYSQLQAQYESVTASVASTNVSSDSPSTPRTHHSSMSSLSSASDVDVESAWESGRRTGWEEAASELEHRAQEELAAAVQRAQEEVEQRRMEIIKQAESQGFQAGVQHATSAHRSEAALLQQRLEEAEQKLKEAQENWKKQTRATEERHAEIQKQLQNHSAQYAPAATESSASAISSNTVPASAPTSDGVDAAIRSNVGEELDQLSHALLAAERRITKLSEELSSQVEQLHPNEADGAGAAHEELKGQLDGLRESLNEAWKQVQLQRAAQTEREQEWKAKKSKWEAERVELQRTVEEQRHQLVETQEALTAARAEAASASARPSSSSSPSHLASPLQLRFEIADLHAEVERLTSALERAQIDLTCRDAECATLNRQIGDLREELADPGSVALARGNALTGQTSSSGVWTALEILFAIQMVGVAIAVAMHFPAVEDAWHDGSTAIMQWMNLDQNSAATYPYAFDA